MRSSARPRSHSSARRARIQACRPRPSRVRGRGQSTAIAPPASIAKAASAAGRRLGRVSRVVRALADVAVRPVRVTTIITRAAAATVADPSVLEMRADMRRLLPVTDATDFAIRGAYGCKGEHELVGHGADD